MITKINFNCQRAALVAHRPPLALLRRLLPGQNAAPGEVVALQDQQGRFLGQALYSAASRIALRLLTTAEDPVDLAFWEATRTWLWPIAANCSGCQRLASDLCRG